uniref:Uncharacterized protein n=1 Tax=Oncorhynchus mykiss TaxID=8022 RepID=A0A8C7QE01_ONCMY
MSSATFACRLLLASGMFLWFSLMFGLPVAVHVAVDVLHRGELVGRLDMGEQQALITEDLGAVDALQVGAVRQLGVAGHYVLLQVIITICNAKHRQN